MFAAPSFTSIAIVKERNTKAQFRGYECVPCLQDRGVASDIRTQSV